MAVEFVIARTPESGLQTDVEGVWSYDYYDPYTDSKYYVLYTFKSHTVAVLSIAKRDAQYQS